jgi:hypothetical protein
MDNKELINEIRDRIQFLITIYILFSTVVYGFYKSIGSDEPLSNSNAFTLTVGVSCYIVIYLVVGNFAQVESRLMKGLKSFINVNLFFLVLPLLVLPSALHNSLPGYYEWPFRISLWGTLWLPILVLAVVMLLWGWHGPFRKK